jgi:hypothetical protein
VLPSSIRITRRIPIKNGISYSYWRLHNISKKTNTSGISISDIISKSGISDVSRKGISFIDKQSSTNTTSPVAGKCTVGNVDMSPFSQPQTAAVSFGCVVAKKAVSHCQSAIALADAASSRSPINSSIVNKSAIFQQHLIGRIAK